MTPRLLSLNNFHYRRAGSDAMFLDHDALFASRGWLTAVFSMHHRENMPSAWSDTFVREIEFERDYSLAQKARIAANVLYSFEARRKLKALLSRFPPDVVHVHSVYHHISPAVLPVLSALGVPIVLTAHDYKLACPAYKMFDGRSICEDCRDGRLLPLVRKACIRGSRPTSALVAVEAILHRALSSYRNHVSAIVCPSRFMQRKLAQWGWPGDRLIHIPNFFDARMWQPQFAPGDYFLYFGRLAPEKGIATLIDAAARSNCKVVIVGDGPLRGQLMQRAHAANAPVDFKGRVDAKSLVSWIQRARAVVVPSVEYENGSLAILEAGACGKPVIAADIGGNPEFVDEGSTGSLFPSGNTEALAAQLLRMKTLADREVRSMGCAARDHVQRHYSAAAYYDAMTALYGRLGAPVRADAAASAGIRA